MPFGERVAGAFRNYSSPKNYSRLLAAAAFTFAPITAFTGSKYEHEHYPGFTDERNIAPTSAQILGGRIRQAVRKYRESTNAVQFSGWTSRGGALLQVTYVSNARAASDTQKVNGHAAYQGSEAGLDVKVLRGQGANLLAREGREQNPYFNALSSKITEGSQQPPSLFDYFSHPRIFVGCCMKSQHIGKFSSRLNSDNKGPSLIFQFPDSTLSLYAIDNNSIGGPTKAVAYSFDFLKGNLPIGNVGIEGRLGPEVGLMRYGNARNDSITFPWGDIKATLLVHYSAKNNLSFGFGYNVRRIPVPHKGAIHTKDPMVSFGGNSEASPQFFLSKRF